MKKRRPWPIGKKLTAVLIAVLVSVAANAAALWWAVDSSAEARRENCDRVVAGLDVFTDSLGEAFEASTEDVEAFRADWHEPLTECS